MATRGTQVTLTVPDGAPPGTLLNVPVRGGAEQVRIRVPDGVGAGSTLILTQPEGMEEWGVKVGNLVPASNGESHPKPVPSQGQPASPTTNSEVVSYRPEADQPGPSYEPTVAFTVRLETTVGAIDIIVRPDWAPLGTRRFLELAAAGDLADLAFYRAIQGCIVQFGLPAKRSWPCIPDDPPTGVPFLLGAVSFAAIGKDTRRSTLFICIGDMSHMLGEKSWETPIGAVAESSLDVLERIDTTYGDIAEFGGAGPDTSRINSEGNDYLQSNFPKLTWISRSSPTDWPPPGEEVPPPPPLKNAASVATPSGAGKALDPSARATQASEEAKEHAAAALSAAEEAERAQYVAQAKAAAARAQRAAEEAQAAADAAKKALAEIGTATSTSRKVPGAVSSTSVVTPSGIASIGQGRQASYIPPMGSSSQPRPPTMMNSPQVNTTASYTAAAPYQTPGQTPVGALGSQSVVHYAPPLLSQQQQQQQQQPQQPQQAGMPPQLQQPSPMQQHQQQQSPQQPQPYQFGAGVSYPQQSQYPPQPQPQPQHQQQQQQQPQYPLQQQSPYPPPQHQQPQLQSGQPMPYQQQQQQPTQIPGQPMQRPPSMLHMPPPMPMPAPPPIQGSNYGQLGASMAPAPGTTGGNLQYPSAGTGGAPGHYGYPPGANVLIR